MASETTQRGDTRLRLSPRPAASKQRRRILVLHLKRARLKRTGRMFKTNLIRPEFLLPVVLFLLLNGRSFIPSRKPHPDIPGRGRPPPACGAGHS